jgi:putative sterol carrier protein
MEDKMRAAAAPRVEGSLGKLLERAKGRAGVRDGDVVLHLSGEGGGEYLISVQSGAPSLRKSAMRTEGRRPLFEVWGPAATVRAILDGEKDPVKQFLAGKMRIRGDLRYFSRVASDLGILKQPL